MSGPDLHLVDEILDPYLEQKAEAQEARGAQYLNNDTGAAQRLVDDNPNSIRYVEGHGYYTYTGMRWEQDEGNHRVFNKVQALVDRMIAETEANEPKMIKAAINKGNAARIEAVIKTASHNPAIHLDIDDFDPDPWLLNCQNGTVDLRTGEVREHRPEDLITRVCAHNYNPEADDAEWLRTVDRASGDPAVARFLQVASGYSATGLTSEARLLFLYGRGATGKTTIIESVKAAMGDYARTVNFKAFLQTRSEGPTPDIARLAGARLVTSVEVDDGKRLAEGVVKSVTGGDKIPARYLHQNTFEYTPRFTLWLVANTRPAASANDDAMWRRITQVPLDNVIPDSERDKDILERLKKDEAVLAWIVQGAVAYSAHRQLDIPEAVQRTTDDYRTENDPIAEWMDQLTERKDTARTLFKALYGSYTTWCSNEHEEPVTKRAFGTALAGHGFEKVSAHNNARAYRGVALRDEGPEW